MGNSKAIDAACQRATVGQLVDNALTVHESVLPSLEPLLRIYEGCARALVGSIEGANLVKLHRHSGKVSYIVYPDFETVAFPKIQLRVKVALRSLAIDVFDYSNWPDPPVLFRKDEVLPSDHPKMKLFKSLSTQLKQAGILPSAEARFTQETWAKILTESGYQIRGHKLVSSDTSRAIRPQS